MRTEQEMEYLVADISLFAFDQLINLEALIKQLDDSNVGMRLEVPRAVFDLIRDNEMVFHAILRDINPGVSDQHLNIVTNFLSNNSNIIPRYDLGEEEDFDYLPESLMRTIVGKTFRRSPDRTNRHHIDYYYQIVHALEIGKAQSPPVRRKMIAYVRNFKKGITDSTDLLHNATLSVLDSTKRGIVLCKEGIHATGETLHSRAKAIQALGKEVKDKVSEEISSYTNRKHKIIKYYFRNSERAMKTGSAILAIAGVTTATIFSYPSLGVMIGTALTGAPIVYNGIIFVVNGKDDLDNVA